MTFEALHQATLGELLSIQATRYANQPFLKLGQETITYTEAEYQATAMAAGLRRLGLLPGDRLAVILPNIPAYVITFFAAMKAGIARLSNGSLYWLTLRHCLFQLWVPGPQRRSSTH
jgi:long-chain acyl-CoA synthetase